MKLFDLKKLALAGSRTRISCLEGNYANRYTTNALHIKYIEIKRIKILRNHSKYDALIRFVQLGMFYLENIYFMHSMCSLTKKLKEWYLDN